VCLGGRGGVAGLVRVFDIHTYIHACVSECLPTWFGAIYKHRSLFCEQTDLPYRRPSSDERERDRERERARARAHWYTL